MKDLRALQFISSFCVLKREAVVSAGFCRSRIKINVLGPATGNVSHFAEGSDGLDLISMLSSACFVHTLYNHHLLRERRLFHAPKTHSFCMQNIRFIGGPRVLDCKSMGWCWCSVWLDSEKRKLPLADAWAATEILWNVRLRSLVVQHGIRNE